MIQNEAVPEQVIHRSVTINAPIYKVWDALTRPALMKQWMSPDTEIEIVTDWTIGSPMIISGPWYKSGFENKGTVLSFEPEREVAYNHLSSLSRLPDAIENYTEMRFRLTAEADKTIVYLTLSNFPTYAIYKHLAFYWSVALELLRKFVTSV